MHVANDARQKYRHLHKTRARKQGASLLRVFSPPPFSEAPPCITYTYYLPTTYDSCLRMRLTTNRFAPLSPSDLIFFVQGRHLLLITQG